MELEKLIEEATAPSPWDVGNDVLYSLCRTRPLHTEVPDVIAKVWLIGRSYAAAIERRKNKVGDNDDFYVEAVGPEIVASDLDVWINEAKQYNRPSVKSFPTILKVHNETTQLFSSISGLEKRSLASKYLHFHIPRLFYIYDTRAVHGLSKLGKLLPRAGRSNANVDNEYRKFAEKCLSLQEYIISNYGTTLTPREIDNLLLLVQERSG